MRFFARLEDVDGNLVIEAIRGQVDNADDRGGWLFLDKLFVDRDVALRLLNDPGGTQPRYRLVAEDGRSVLIFLMGGKGSGNSVRFLAKGPLPFDLE